MDENKGPQGAPQGTSESTPDNVMDDLKGLLEELKVKAHLGKMEAKDAWKKVEPEIRRSISQIKSAVREFVQNVKSKDKEEEPKA